MATSPDPSDTFRQEAQDLLVQLEDVLLDLEASPGERDLIDTAFRALHTLKGSGAMFGFDDLARFAHVVENTFDRLRKAQTPPSRALIAATLAAKDFMRQLLLSPGEADSAVGETLLGELLRQSGGSDLSASNHAAQAVQPAAASAGTEARSGTYDITFSLPRDCLARGTNPLLLLDELRGLGACAITADTSGIPPLDTYDPEQCYVRWRARLTTSQPPTAIEDVFMFVIDDMELTIRKIEEKEAPPLSVEKAEPAFTDTARAPAAPQAACGAAAAPQSSSIRVSAERIDSLMDRVGELVIAQSRLKQISQASQDATLRAVTEEIERLSAELRGATMGIRMLPIGHLFSRFRRVVHDLSRDLGKDVHLVTSGEETELDKTVIESLNDPLVHLIRNAIDHGLESAEDREAAGKPSTGTLSLAAQHAGTQVLITIGDDGRGMNRARIREKAVEAGLLPSAGEVTDRELFQTIFSPGFSTATSVTNVSGRGVGMDVVKRTIDGLHGSIEVDSVPGQGARITLKLPLTLAIIDGLLVRVGTGRYVLPLSSIEECVELSETDSRRSNGRSFLNIRGDLVPFLRLRDAFAVTSPNEPFQKVVIVTSGDMRVGLVVDQIIGDHQTVIKSLSKLHADVMAFSGATILGDGTVALILDVANLIATQRGQEPQLKAS